jgi:hypothetical protein
MAAIAAELKVAPTQISFVTTLRFFVEQWTWAVRAAFRSCATACAVSCCHHVARNAVFHER